MKILVPCAEQGQDHGYSFGLGPAGYDLRVHFDPEGKVVGLVMDPGSFILASTLERFYMPLNVMGIVHDKSSWARRGLAVQNTVIEPGWRGYLTLELTNHGRTTLYIPKEVGIAQVIFHYVEEQADPYQGKYQDQEKGPVEARL